MLVTGVVLLDQPPMTLLQLCVNLLAQVRCVLYWTGRAVFRVYARVYV